MRVWPILWMLTGCGRLGFQSNSDAGYRQHIRIDNAARAEAFVDFPVMVALDATRIAYADAQPDGRDLRFFDSTGEPLEYEIESWDPVGQSIVWVRIPMIDAGSDQDSFWMDYGNAMGAVPATGTWSADHVAVYHFAGSLVDATAAANDGSAVGAMFPLGLAGTAMHFEQLANDYGVIPYRPAFDEVITLSGWMNLEMQITQFSSLLSHPEPGDFRNSEYLLVHGGVIEMEVLSASGSFQQVQSIPIALSKWTHLALVVRDPVSSMYVDGALVGTLASPGGVRRAQTSYFVGADCDACTVTALVPNSDPLRGAVDEIRLERVARSGAWIDAQVASMRDSLLVFE